MRREQRRRWKKRRKLTPEGRAKWRIENKKSRRLWRKRKALIKTISKATKIAGEIIGRPITTKEFIEMSYRMAEILK